MRVAVVNDRLKLLTAPDRGVDVNRASAGRFPSQIEEAYLDWEAFCDWARGIPQTDGEPLSLDSTAIGAPSPRPRQVFAIALNYRTHAREAGLDIPSEPSCFTKFPSCITGPRTEVVLPPGGTVDWEVELVAVIGRQADYVRAEDGWAHVAGFTVGQDLSERRMQTAGPAPQFGLGKSFRGFGPTGPCLVTPDEFDDPDDLELGCLVNGESVQKDRTSSFIFPIPELIAWLSAVCTLYPGDLVFTGTPSGIGHTRTPPQYLQPGDELTSWVAGIGTLRQRFADHGRK